MANYQDRVTTLRDILQMSPEERKSTYRVDSSDKHIDKVTINGNVFTDYSAFSFLWEKSYVKSPVRSGDGTIGNLNSYSTFLTPHLKIDFGLMSIDSYRKIMQLIYSSNEFLVTCYDVVNNKDTTNKMYFSTEEMPKLWTIVDALNGDENAIMLLGVQDYTVEMIGTNADVKAVTVNYYLNAPISGQTTTPIGSFDTAIGGEIILGADSNIGDYGNNFDGYAFSGKWRLGSPSGTKYDNNDSFEITKALVDETSNSINFYAVWKETNTYTLTYAYGLGAPKIDPTTMKEITNKQVTYGWAIGTLPNSEALPSVEYNEQTYYPYTFKGWYKNPQGVGDQLTANTPYWVESDTVIYQVYLTEKHTVYWIVDGDLYSDMYLEYNATVPMPNLVKTGYKLDGWYTNEEYKNKFSGNMPPHPLYLYARWVKQ